MPGEMDRRVKAASDANAAMQEVWTRPENGQGSGADSMLARRAIEVAREWLAGLPCSAWVRLVGTRLRRRQTSGRSCRGVAACLPVDRWTSNRTGRRLGVVRRRAPLMPPGTECKAHLLGLAALALPVECSPSFGVRSLDSRIPNS